ncbi:hypothetical protein [Streptomyces sp. NBC_00203]|uniref:hypothetical protein n=1 Tax=Streptomyces sp. NBC_00203 TaxID=2975680 RepID=UPI003249D2F6
MKTILVSVGTGCIGLQTAREFVARGNRVVLLSRDRRKGAEAILRRRGRPGIAHPGRPVDPRRRTDAAQNVLAVQDRFDANLHSTGVLAFKEMRTADGLHPFLLGRPTARVVVIGEDLGRSGARVPRTSATLGAISGESMACPCFD